MPGPLDGIRVIELAVVIAGPSAAAMLGDWGADVIKVEPLQGDPQRGNTVSAYFELDNRGKRSLALNVKSNKGREILLSLLDDADVFISNIRAGALHRLGLDYDSLSSRNPRLVYGLITGYGTSGTAANKAGYDVGAFWSRAGVAGTLVGSDAEPPVPRPGMGDHTAGLAMVAGLASALYERERRGYGQFVTTSLLRAGTFVISSDLMAEMNGATPEVGLRRAMYNPLLACYRAGDGRWFWLLGLEAERHWPNVLRALDRLDLLEDERFGSFGRLMRNSKDVIAILDEEFAKRPLEQWAEILDRHGVWWDPVQDVHGMLHDSVVNASGAIRAMADGMRTVASPVDFGSFNPPEAARAPGAGQHTEEILLEMGYDWPEIIELKDSNVIP